MVITRRLECEKVECSGILVAILGAIGPPGNAIDAARFRSSAKIAGEIFQLARGPRDRRRSRSGRRTLAPVRRYQLTADQPLADGFENRDEGIVLALPPRTQDIVD